MSGEDSGIKTPCSHNSIYRVNDYKSGDEICGKCGTVIGRLLTPPLPPLSPNPVHFFPGSGVELENQQGGKLTNKLKKQKKFSLKTSDKKDTFMLKDREEEEDLFYTNDKTINKEARKREELYQYCTLLNVDNAAVVETAMSVLKRIEEALECEEKTSFSFFPRPYHMAYAIWDALSTHGCPRSPKTIANCCGTEAKKILRLENNLLKNEVYTKGTNMLSNSNNPPSMYCETACDMLYLPYAVTLIVKSLVTCYEDEFQGCRPESVVAAAILLICERVRKLNVSTPKLLKIQAKILHIDLDFIQAEFASVTAKTVKDMKIIMSGYEVAPKYDKLYITFKR